MLDGAEAEVLRTLLAEQTRAAPTERAPARGLARLLRRNPTEAERTLWDALTKDRRFAGHGFKRQTPSGDTWLTWSRSRCGSWSISCRARKARRRRRPRGAARLAHAARLSVVAVTAAEVERDVGSGAR